MKHRSFICALALAFFPFFAMNSSAFGSIAADVDWPGYNNDLASLRFATPTVISGANISTLHPICTATLPQQRNVKSGPIVISGVLYVSSLGNTYAFDAATCAPKWTNVYGITRGNNRGLAYANGAIFRGYLDGHVSAIDARTGRTLWNRNELPINSHEYIAAAPIAYQGALYIGTAGGDSGEPCHVMAIDQRTGAILWSVQTVPVLGTPLAASWQNATRIAGGATWASYSLDTRTGLIYLGTGNPGPDFYGATRLGANLGSDSLMAINAFSGQVQASIQIVAHDFHDWDLGATPAIVRVGNRDAVALAGGKDGYLRSIDVATGIIGWRTPITTIANETAPIALTGTHFCPGTLGGVLWNGPAYSPRTGLTYIGSTDQCATLDLASAPPTYVPGKLWLGSTNNFGTLDTRQLGYVTALDETTGAVRWRFQTPTAMTAALTPTAGGIVFAGDRNGTLYAFDDLLGKVRKSIQMTGPIIGGIIAYEVAGKEFIAVNVDVPKSSPASSTIVVLGL